MATNALSFRPKIKPTKLTNCFDLTFIPQLNQMLRQTMSLLLLRLNKYRKMYKVRAIWVLWMNFYSKRTEPKKKQKQTNFHDQLPKYSIFKNVHLFYLDYNFLSFYSNFHVNNKFYVFFSYLLKNLMSTNKFSSTHQSIYWSLTFQFWDH